jgi:hypothetical protein
MASVDDRVHVGPQLASAVEGIDAASRQARQGGHTLGGFVRRCNAVGYGFFARCRGCGVEVAVHRVGQMWTYPDSLPGCSARADAPSPSAESNGAGPRPALRVLGGGELDGARERDGRREPARRPPAGREAAPPRPAPPGGGPGDGPAGGPAGGTASTPITDVLAAARLAAHRSGHRLGVFRRSNGGRKFVAGCHRCGWELPILHTDRGWCFPPPSRRCSGP